VLPPGKRWFYYNVGSALAMLFRRAAKAKEARGAKRAVARYKGFCHRFLRARFSFGAGQEKFSLTRIFRPARRGQARSWLLGPLDKSKRPNEPASGQRAVDDTRDAGVDDGTRAHGLGRVVT
jgi:hypothetical protein